MKTIVASLIGGCATACAVLFIVNNHQRTDIASPVLIPCADGTTLVIAKEVFDSHCARRRYGPHGTYFTVPLSDIVLPPEQPPPPAATPEPTSKPAPTPSVTGLTFQRYGCLRA